jgi:hypothetical protein
MRAGAFRPLPTEWIGTLTLPAVQSCPPFSIGDFRRSGSKKLILRFVGRKRCPVPSAVSVSGWLVALQRMRWLGNGRVDHFPSSQGYFREIDFDQEISLLAKDTRARW